MSYKRAVKKKGKSYGPYIYQSYRDPVTGKVKKRYLGKVEEKKVSKKFLFLLGFMILSTLIIVGYSTDYLANDGDFSKKFVEQTGRFAGSAWGRVTGFAVDDGGDSGGVMAVIPVIPEVRIVERAVVLVAILEIL